MFGFFRKLLGKGEDDGPAFDKNGKPIKKDVRGELTVEYEQLEREDPIHYSVKGRKTVKLHLTQDVKDGETLRFRDFDGAGSDLFLKIRIVGRKRAEEEETPDYLMPPDRL